MNKKYNLYTHLTDIIKYFSKGHLAKIITWMLIVTLSGCFGGVSKKNWQIGRQKTWGSLFFKDKEPSFQAFLGELLVSIAQKEKFRFQLSDVYENPLDILNEDLLDAILMTITPSNFFDERYILSDTVYPTGPVLVIRKGETISSFADLQGKVIGTSSASLLTKQIERYPSVWIITYETAIEALELLRQDKIDGVLMPFVQASGYIRVLYPNELKIATPPLTDEGIRLVAKKNEDGKKIISLFNKGVDELKKEGEYDALIARWDLPDPLETWETDNKPNEK